MSREDVADLCVHLLYSKAARNTTFEIKSKLPFTEEWPRHDATVATTDWDAVLHGANLKAGVTGKTIRGVYTGTCAEAEAGAEEPSPVEGEGQVVGGARAGAHMMATAQRGSVKQG